MRIGIVGSGALGSVVGCLLLESGIDTVIVEVPNPLEVSGDRPPLLPNAFVEVFIAGRVLADAIAVPRDAVKDGNKVWLVNDNHLRIVSLDIVRADKEHAYVTDGIDDEALIVVSSLDTAIEGMKVRMQSDEQTTKNALDNDQSGLM